MRGKGKPWALFFRVHRITPAYAGKSSLTLSHKLIQKDHPRLCGEKFLKETFYNGNKGSPPPMRGKAGFLAIRAYVLRITPAYAGKSPLAIFKKSLVKGSPPPMRGKVCELTKNSVCFRITPAYAGKSLAVG